MLVEYGADVSGKSDTGGGVGRCAGREQNILFDEWGERKGQGIL